MLKLGKYKTKIRLTSDLVSYLLLLFNFLVFSVWRLGSLVPGLSAGEVASRTASHNWQNIFSQPINAPYHLLQTLTLSLNPGVFGLRFSTVIIAGLLVFAIYKITAGYFGDIIGVMSGLIFTALPLFAISSRQGTPQIMFFIPAAIVSIYLAMIRNQHKKNLWLLLMLVAGLAIYTPGILWWIMGAILLAHKKVVAVISELTSGIKWLGISVFCLVITPLIFSLLLHPSNIKHLMALPERLPQITELFSNVAKMFGSIVYKSPGRSELVLANLPLLSLGIIVLVVFGGYALFISARNKAWGLLAGIFLSAILAGLNRKIGFMALGIPFLIITAAAGLRYLFVEWRIVFPRNPVPKNFALVLIVIVSLSQLNYSAYYVLSAWPNNTEIRSRYMLK